MKGFRAPKYSCTICNKTFRRSKQHYNHVQRNTCGNKKVSTAQGITMTLTEIRETYPEQQYYGREYNFNNIPSGNRHLRSGLPFANDPLRREIAIVKLVQNMENIGPLPRLSKYRSAAI